MSMQEGLILLSHLRVQFDHAHGRHSSRQGGIRERDRRVLHRHAFDGTKPTQAQVDLESLWNSAERAYFAIWRYSD
jgi:hypothetical protein